MSYEEELRLKLKTSIYAAGYKRLQDFLDEIGVHDTTLRGWYVNKPKMIEFFIKALRKTDDN